MTFVSGCPKHHDRRVHEIAPVHYKFDQLVRLSKFNQKYQEQTSFEDTKQKFGFSFHKQNNPGANLRLVISPFPKTFFALTLQFF